MKYKIRTMLATGAAMTALALTLGQTAFAQNDAALGVDKANGSGNGQAYGQERRPADCPCLEDQLTFEEMQAKMLERMVNNEARLKEKLANVDTLDVSDDVKAKMKEHLNARLLEIGKTISQVKAATDKEDLQQIRKERNPGLKMGWKKNAGNGKGKGLMRRLDR
jgi:hypothetical protein